MSIVPPSPSNNHLRRQRATKSRPYLQRGSRLLSPRREASIPPPGNSWPGSRWDTKRDDPDDMGRPSGTLRRLLYPGILTVPAIDVGCAEMESYKQGVNSKSRNFRSRAERQAYSSPTEKLVQRIVFSRTRNAIEVQPHINISRSPSGSWARLTYVSSCIRHTPLTALSAIQSFALHNSPTIIRI